MMMMSGDAIGLLGADPCDIGMAPSKCDWSKP
jgi:hypothetical protein